MGPAWLLIQLAQTTTPAAGGLGGDNSTFWAALSAVGAIVAAVFAGGAVWYARTSAKASRDSAGEAKNANKIAHAQFLLAKEGIELDRVTAEYQRETDRQARTARVVLSSNDGRALWVYTSGDGFGKIGVRVKNEGAALARDVRLEVHRNGDRSPVERGPIAKLGDEPEMFLFHARWGKDRFPVEDDMYELRFFYRDDLDTHSLARCYRFTGGACPDWKAVEAECPSDGGLIDSAR